MGKVRARAWLPCGLAVLGWVFWFVFASPPREVDEVYAGILAGFAGAVLLALAFYPTRADAESGARGIALLLRFVAAGLTVGSLVSGLTAALPGAQHQPQLVAGLSTAATASFGVVIGLLVGSLVTDALDIWAPAHRVSGQECPELERRLKQAATSLLENGQREAAEALFAEVEKLKSRS